MVDVVNFPKSSAIDEPVRLAFPSGASVLLTPDKGRPLTVEHAVHILEQAKLHLLLAAREG